MMKLSTIGCASLLVVASCGSGGSEPSTDDLVQALARVGASDAEAGETCSLVAEFLSREELVEMFESQPAGFFSKLPGTGEIEEEDQAVLDEYGVTVADIDALFAEATDSESAEILADSMMLSCAIRAGDGPDGADPG